MQQGKQLRSSGFAGRFAPAMAVCFAFLRLAVAADDPATRSATDSPVAPTTEPSPHMSDDWFGFRSKLADRGVSFDVTFTIDGTKNLRGGLDTEGTRWRRLLDAAVTVDTTPLLRIEGGTAYVEFQDAQGPNASDELVGDIQGIDGLDGVPGAAHQNRTQIAQLWYQQIVVDGALRLKAGKVDANSEFDHSDIAGEFLHQSTGSSATLFTLPTYPDPSLGVNFFLKPRADLQVGFGIYDGSLADGVRTGELGPQPLLHGRESVFLIAEVDQSWTLGSERLAGRVAIGGWYSTNHFKRLDGRDADGTGAPYALLEQTLWRANSAEAHDPRGISIFVMYGYADPAILAYDHNLGGGI